jgi:hypothetical protein
MRLKPGNVSTLLIKHLLRMVTLVILFTTITACVGQNPAASPTQAQMDPTPTSEDPPASTPTANGVDETLGLFMDGSVPPEAINLKTLSNITFSDEEDAFLWFGPISQALNDNFLAKSIWVYALAAPFPTLTDDVSSSELAAFWQGELEGAFSSVTRLYVPENIVGMLDSRWGNHDDSLIETYTTIPAPDALWDENAWAILPFDSLSVELKVISVDGISPLFTDFDSEAYPLIFEYVLVLNEDSEGDLSEHDIMLLSAAIQNTNRNPNRLTTLVMTGVTALVRATAYKMEVNGITYPGEEIVEWLAEADLTHISNEVSFYEGCPYPDPNYRSLFFCSNPDYIELLDFIGADIIELTGNHNNDSLVKYGVDVVPFSLDLYQEYGMVYYGGGLNLEDATSATLVTHNGNRLAFIGCNYSGPDFAWATETGGGAAPCGDYQWMTDEINRLTDEGYMVIATFQYEENYSNTAGENQIKDFSLMAEAGAVIVNGSQAHRPKGMAFDQGVFVDYGLGNLFFDQMGILDDYGNQILQTRWEVIQRHTFYAGKLLSTELLTAMLEDYAQPRPMTEDERLIFLEEIFTASGWEPR